MPKNEERIWENQNNIRVANQIKVMSFLRQGSESCSSLASKIGLSNTATEKVVDELYDQGILERAGNERKKTKGRTPDMYKINENLGVVAGVDLSGRDIVFAVADLSNRILIRDRIKNVLMVSKNTLTEIMDRLETMLKDEKMEGRKLLSICISSPGKIDKETNNYIYAPRIEDYEHINVCTMFKERFSVPVYVYNDVNMGVIGEKAFGVINQNEINVFFAHIDVTAGSSLILNNKLFKGSHGFAGEVADYKPIDSFSKDIFSGKLYTITDIIKEIKKNIIKDSHHPLYGQELLKLDDMVDLFLSNDKIVTDAVIKSAKYNAITLLSFTNLLDLDSIVIEGSMLQFGDKFKRLLEKYYKEYDNNHNTCKIAYSTLNNNAILLGSIYQGINMFYLKEFEKMVINRTNNQNYKIEDYFETL